MRKKSQVTVFIIIGIVLLIAFAFIFSLSPSGKLMFSSKSVDYYANNLVANIEDCIDSTTREGIGKVGLKQDLLKQWVDSNSYKCIQSSIDAVKKQKVKITSENPSLDLTMGPEAIVVKLFYPLNLMLGNATKTIEDFYITVPMEEEYEIETDASCRLKEKLIFFSPDRGAKIQINKGAVIKDKDENCLDKVSVRMLDADITPLSVFRVGYDFKPDGATISPYFETWMEYNQEDFERVKATHPDGNQMKEENLMVTFYDTEIHSDWQSLAGRIGNVFRPYDDFPQSVDALNNIIYARPNHFTQIYTLSGCGEVYKSYYKDVAIVPLGSGTPQCTGQSATGTVSWSVSGDYESCYGKSSVSAFLYVSPGDTLSGTQGDTGSASLTSEGSHSMTATVTDSNQLAVDGSCGYVGLYVRFEGVGVSSVSMTSGNPTFAGTGTYLTLSGETVSNPSWETVTTSIIGEENNEESEESGESGESGEAGSEEDSEEEEGDCSDGTEDNSCSILTPGKYCYQGQLIDRCSLCTTYCTSAGNYACKDNLCVAKCNDGTLSGSCSTQPGKYCSDGSLINGCSTYSCSCANGYYCNDNVCSTPSCNDTDGLNYYNKGTTGTQIGEDSSSYEDKCTSSTLTEYYCQNNLSTSKQVTCIFGCDDGKCLRDSSVTKTENIIFEDSKVKVTAYNAYNANELAIIKFDAKGRSYAVSGAAKLNLNADFTDRNGVTSSKQGGPSTTPYIWHINVTPTVEGKYDYAWEFDDRSGSSSFYCLDSSSEDYVE